MSSAVETATGIRPFQVEFSQEQVDELRRRIAAARWPSEELVDDRSHGVQSASSGAESSGEGAAKTMKLVADDVQTLVIPGIGHWLAEQAPDELTSALTEFLSPYHDEDG